jgi:hypothetical protein
VSQAEEARGAPSTGIAYSAGSTPRQIERLNEILDSALPRARPAVAMEASGTMEAVESAPPTVAAPAREPRDVAAMSDHEVVEYLLEVLPPDYRMPSVHDCGYNVYQALRAVAASVQARQGGQRGAAKVPKEASRRRLVPSAESVEVAVEQETGPGTTGAREEPQPRRKRGKASRNASAAATGAKVSAEDAEEARRAARVAKRQRVVDKSMNIPFL